MIVMTAKNVSTQGGVREGRLHERTEVLVDQKIRWFDHKGLQENVESNKQTIQDQLR